jgi:citrate/tricarballylate utilization protein
LPAALAEVRHDSWEEFAYPSSVARVFQKSGMAIVMATILGFALLFAAAKWLGQGGGDGFYAVMSHNLMVSIFAPAFLFPLFSIGISLRRYWMVTDGENVEIKHIKQAFSAAASMRNLSGGHGDGCNFEEEDRFSQARRVAHQLVLYGFLLCFASTASGTILHYVFDLSAPYTLYSLPKLFGVPGGLMMMIGAVWMLILKLRADPKLGAIIAWGGEVAFIALLGFVALSGLAVYALGETALMPALLALHLGAVLSFFLLMPYTKMAHGFYRLAALIRDAQRLQG